MKAIDHKRKILRASPSLSGDKNTESMNRYLTAMWQLGGQCYFRENRTLNISALIFSRTSVTSFTAGVKDEILYCGKIKQRF
jgi:hypothetical protein